MKIKHLENERPYSIRKGPYSESLWKIIQFFQELGFCPVPKDNNYQAKRTVPVYPLYQLTVIPVLFKFLIPNPRVLTIFQGKGVYQQSIPISTPKPPYPSICNKARLPQQGTPITLPGHHVGGGTTGDHVFFENSEKHQEASNFRSKE